MNRIEIIFNFIDEETSKKVFETVQRQREISERIDGVKRKIIDEERIVEERKMKVIKEFLKNDHYALGIC